MGRKLLYDEDSINDAALAIKSKTGITEKFTVSQFAALIEECGEPESKDVDFYDYDGRRLYSYTSEEFMNLTSMPSLPDHTDIGLVNEGWNWNLKDIKELTDPHLNVGCTYYTSDGKTRIFYDIFKPCTQKIRAYTSVNGGGILDWGDGSEPITLTNSSTIYTHDYDTIGKYEVTLESVNNASVYIGGNSAAAFGNASNGFEPLKTMITGIFCGKNLCFKEYSLRELSDIRFITLNNRMYSGGSEANLINSNYYGYPSNLGAIIIPNNFTMHGWHDFDRCLTRVVSMSPNITTNNPQGTFSYCAVDRFINTFSKSNGVLLDNGVNTRSNLKRVDVMYNDVNSFGLDTVKLYDQDRTSNIRDIYLHKMVALPQYHADSVSNYATLHVPYNMYNDIMTTQWATGYSGRLVQSPKKAWEDDYEVLTHPSELIANTQINGSTGAASTNSGYMATDFIPVTPGETLYVCFNSYSNDCCFYDSEKNRVEGDARLNGRTWNVDHHGYPFAVPATAHYVRLSHGNSYMPYVTLWREVTNE